jgi:hypothetical protein
MPSDDKVGISASGGVTVSRFSGKDEDNDYEEWRDTLVDLIRLKKLKHVLDATFVLPTRQDATTAWTDEQKKLIDDNDTACTWFSFATTGAPKKLIKKKTLAREMLAILDDEYDVGKETEDLQVVQKKFDEIKLSDGEPPSVFFTELEDINNKFDDFQEAGGKDYTKDAKELIIKITESVAKDSKYGATIETWETSTSNSTMTSEEKLNDLKTTLKRYYKKHFQLSGSKTGTGKVIMNVTNDMVCSHCGRKGHTEVQCWKKHPELRPKPKPKGNGNGGKEKKQGPCWICGGPHQKKQCPKYKGNKEGGNNSNNDESINGLFMGVTTITGKDFCIECTGNKDREESIKTNAIECSEGNIGSKNQRFLADSGSMTHAICDESIKLDNEITTNDKVQGFNGSAVYIKSKGNLSVKDISTGSVVELKNARKSSAIKKNIISIGQLQSEGWILRGHDSILVLEKEDQLLRFVKSGEENLYYMDATVVSKAQQTNVMTKVDFVFEEDDDDSDDDIPDLYDRVDDSSSDDDSDDDDSFMIHGNNDDEVLYLHDDKLEVYGMGIDNSDDGGIMLGDTELVELRPSVLLEDNEGCEFLVKNKQVSSRTKHIDIAMHSIREFCSENVEGITRGAVMRVSSEENTSDICTKNTDVATFKYHEEEIDSGFSRLRQKVFDSGIAAKLENQRLLGGMSSEVDVTEGNGNEANGDSGID